MSNCRRIIASTLAAATASTVLLGSASPALADTPSNAAFSVASGGITISTPGDLTLTGNVNSTGDASAAGTFQTVTVNDNRASSSTWTATVTSTAFISSTTTPVSATNVSYKAGDVTSVPSSTTYDFNGPQTDLTKAKKIVVPSSVAGNNSASWIPTLTVTIPATTLVGSYSAKITHSVA